MKLFIDASVVDRLAEDGIVSVDDLTHDFQVSYTPDLHREYQAKLCSSATSETKALTSSILKLGREISFFGFSEEESVEKSPCLGFDQGLWASQAQSDFIARIAQSDRRRPTGIPIKRTDAYLAALSQTALIVTNDEGAHWRTAPAGLGRVIRWKELRQALSQHSLLKALKLFQERLV